MLASDNVLIINLGMNFVTLNFFECVMIYGNDKIIISIKIKVNKKILIFKNKNNLQAILILINNCLHLSYLTHLNITIIIIIISL